MITSIKNAITKAIYQEFGNDHAIHTETVPQGLTPGSFIVTCVSPYVGKWRGNQKKIDVIYGIHYFPVDRERAGEEMDEVYLRLAMCLDKIHTEETELPCMMLECVQKTDDVMTVNVTYQVYVYTTEDVPDMEDMLLDVELGHEEG